MITAFCFILLAHAGELHESAGPQNWHQLWRSWEFDPLVIVPLILSGWLYALGLFRTWRDSGGAGHGIRRWEAACFAAGWLALVVALVSPLHPWGQVLFSAHMTQHEVLMLVAAPLMVLGRPMAAFLRALPAEWAGGLARASNGFTWQRVWSSISNPLAAWTIHAVALWMWHIPTLFEATLHNDFVHALQHASFLLSALLFWWAVMHGQHRAVGYGMAVLYMFTTAMHSGLLGAMITLANNLLYPGYQHTTQAWGLTPIQDQQVGGLIMWIPAGLVYVVAALALCAAWLRESENRVLRREREADHLREAMA